MKRFLTIVAALAALTSLAIADVAVSTQSTGTTFNLLSSGAKRINSITVVPSGTNVILRLYDAATSTNTYVTAAYTTFVPTVSTVISTNTVAGLTQYYTNTAMTMVSTTTAAATNTLPVLRVYATPSGTIGQFDDSILLKNGLTISNTVACTVIVDYESN